MAQADCEWGARGIEVLGEHAAVLVIVDVLSFSTAVDVAVSRGATVYPFPFEEPQAAQIAANSVGAVLAQRRGQTGGALSLSPASLLGLPRGTKLMLPSPNGSRLSIIADRLPNRIPVLTGCLRNAATVAKAARVMSGDGPIAVVPAGEHWPDGTLRPAIEDWFAAGAILDRLNGPYSPEAQVARDAYRTAGHELARLIRLSVSGRELVDRGFAGDIDLAVEQDVSVCAPVLIDGAYCAAH
jgi:2-phosphosulfolactate phosphatase